MTFESFRFPSTLSGLSPSSDALSMPGSCNQLNSSDVVLKHTTTLFALSDHYSLSREWRVLLLLIKYRPIIMVVLMVL